MRSSSLLLSAIMNRTFAIGDIHGELQTLRKLLGRLPTLGPDDTLVFLGDYVDRGPESRQTVEFLRHTLPQETGARLVALLGNHEDGWLRHVREGGWPEFVVPQSNGCMECVRSYLGTTAPPNDERPSKEEFGALLSGTALPEDVLAWMASLPHWFEDDHAIYVHACLPERDGRWLHPGEVEDHHALLWERSAAFFREYQGKRVVCGHTPVVTLPQEISEYTPLDPTDLFQHGSVLAIDTGCGKGGFLTAVELPAGLVYESR
ncbi:MAG: metallophosphoesterase family protein [bacterium]